LFCEMLGPENKYFLLYCQSGYRLWANGFTLIFEIKNEVCQYLTDNTTLQCTYVYPLRFI